MTPQASDPAPGSAFAAAAGSVRQGADATAAAQGLYRLLTPEERLGLLDGDEPFWQGMCHIIDLGYNTYPYVMGAVPRLGVPGLRFVDGPRGAVTGRSTAFPVSMARGATWDTALEERIGRAIGEELRAQGGNFFGGVCVNLPRHPSWGRAQETYSDQPVLLGEMGAALTRGVQAHAMACVKHFALNSMENARFSVDVQVDEATLHEVYLPHFKRVLDAGAFAVMSAYNSVNGEWAGQNRELLTGVLRETWGFEGVVITDFIWGMRDGVRALAAGLDVEAPFAQQRAAALPAALAGGSASWDDVERAGVRILATQLRFYAQRSEERPGPAVVASAPHTALAREAAARSMVLLRNEDIGGRPLLPLAAARLGSLAVVGRLADVPNTGDNGSSRVRAPYVVTPLQGLTDALPGVDVRHDDGADPVRAASLAAGADVAIVIAGYNAADEGEFVDGTVARRQDLLDLYPEPRDETEREQQAKVLSVYSRRLSVVGGGTAGGDRHRLRLREDDVALIRAVAAANPRTIVVVITAGAVLMDEWHEEVPAVLLGWYSGLEGGHALAEVLTGRHNPSGRLPYPIPASEADTPEHDIDAATIRYDRNIGHRLIAANGSRALYPLGYGLAYTTYRLSGARHDIHGTELTTRVQVANTGTRDGIHVVQVYGLRARDAGPADRELLGFAAVPVPAGQSREAVIGSSLTPLGQWDPHSRAVTPPSGDIELETASFWGDPDCLITALRLP